MFGPALHFKKAIVIKSKKLKKLLFYSILFDNPPKFYPPTNDREDSWAQPVEIRVFASPTGYMLTSSGFLN